MLQLKLEIRETYFVKTDFERLKLTWTQTLEPVETRQKNKTVVNIDFHE